MNILRQNKEIHSIISIPNFLSDSEINQIFDLSKEKEFIDAAVGNKLNIEENHNLLTDHKIINPNVGVVKRTRETNLKWIFLDENSNWLFKKVIQCINEINVNNYGYILKFVEDIQFAEYTSQTKGFYSKHTDCGNKFEMEHFVDIRKLSFSIQLSDFNDYEGGELKFYTGKKSIYTNKEEYDVAKKDKGTITFFPSHVLHEVTPVTKGTRYSLVSWVQGPNIL
jgi:PKHD-type hydroxylase